MISLLAWKLKEADGDFCLGSVSGSLDLTKIAQKARESFSLREYREQSASRALVYVGIEKVRLLHFIVQFTVDYIIIFIRSGNCFSRCRYNNMF